VQIPRAGNLPTLSQYRIARERSVTWSGYAQIDGYVG